MKKLQTLMQAANGWVEETDSVLSTGMQITLDKAKGLVAKGEKLNIICPEFRNLRNALRISRGWQLRVKRSKLDSGQVQITDIKGLIAEHNGFLVSVPDEIKKLKEALQGYCLCRRPYEGFMLGCDSCEEWFHGPCIGVSESQAERYDKYVCVRCVISKLYKGCAESVIHTIRKWTNPEDLAKSRQIDGQRHQRKVREKRREIEKLNAEIESMKTESDKHKFNSSSDVGVGVVEELSSDAPLGDDFEVSHEIGPSSTIAIYKSPQSVTTATLKEAINDKGDDGMAKLDSGKRKHVLHSLDDISEQINYEGIARGKADTDPNGESRKLVEITMLCV